MPGSAEQADMAGSAAVVLELYKLHAAAVEVGTPAAAGSNAGAVAQQDEESASCTSEEHC